MHRGCVLGALLGAAHGGNFAGWVEEGLVARDDIESEITAFTAALAGDGVGVGDADGDGTGGVRADL